MVWMVVAQLPLASFLSPMMLSHGVKSPKVLLTTAQRAAEG